MFPIIEFYTIWEKSNKPHYIFLQDTGHRVFLPFFFYFFLHQHLLYKRECAANWGIKICMIGSLLSKSWQTSKWDGHVTHCMIRWHYRNTMSLCRRESWWLAGWQIKAPCLYPVCLQLLLLFTSSISDLFQGWGSDPADPVAAETIWFLLLSVFKSHFVVDSILNELTELRSEFPESWHLIWGTHCLWTWSDYLRHWL